LERFPTDTALGGESLCFCPLPTEVGVVLLGAHHCWRGKGILSTWGVAGAVPAEVEEEEEEA
jgi:hypothetical protein